MHIEERELVIMSNFIKKSAMVLIALSLLCAITLPSFALDLSSGDFQPVFGAEYSIMATGNGYNTQDIVYNGQTYSCTLSVGSGSSGAYSRFYTLAATGGHHGNVNVSFLTINHGYVSASGGNKSRPAAVGESFSYFVTCPYGYSQVVGYQWISATGKIPSGSSEVSFYCRAA
jgi:hypothetical protein